MNGQTGGSSAPAAADAASPHGVLPAFDDTGTGPTGARPPSSPGGGAAGGVANLTVADGVGLARFAARVVAATLAQEPVDGRAPRSPAQRALGASFVTLQRRGELRGCIGTLEAVRPLYVDVARNAVRAMSDPRLARVTADDWPELDLSVSVLGPLRPLRVSTLDELQNELRPGVDGVVITAGPRRATFLPVVWEKLSDPTKFLSSLLAKGGWPTDRLPVAAEVCVYAAAEFHDPAPVGGRARPGAAPPR
jgi:AmmeMemoRadiSam system protein A